MTRVLIAGAGALGGFLAFALQAAGQDVALLARGRRLRVLRSSGLALARAAGVLRVDLPASSDARKLGIPRIVMLATKWNALPQVLDALAPIADHRPAFVTLQNGVEAHRLVANRFPRSAVIAARVHGFFEMADDVVRHVGVEPSILYGMTAGQGEDAVAALARMLSAAGITHEQADCIETALWQKLLLVSSIGAVATACGASVGRLRFDVEGWRMLEAAMIEVRELAQRKGVILPGECVAQTLSFVAGFPHEATSSLQRDLEALRPSEYDALTGAVIRMARECSQPVPVHLAAEAKLRERGLLP